MYIYIYILFLSGVRRAWHVARTSTAHWVARSMGHVLCTLRTWTARKCESSKFGNCAVQGASTLYKYMMTCLSQNQTICILVCGWGVWKESLSLKCAIRRPFDALSNSNLHSEIHRLEAFVIVPRCSPVARTAC